MGAQKPSPAPRAGLAGLLTSPAVVGLATAGLGALAYATLIERNLFTLREATLPVLEPGTPSLKILHISDAHMTPNQRLKARWIAELDRLDPDLVVNTGDNLSHARAVPTVVQAYDRLLSRPGFFVFGSNDYFGPKPKNPFQYFDKDHKRSGGAPLPWRDMRSAFVERGWVDLTHVRHEVEINGVRIAAAGVDDPHIKRDRYETIGGPPNPLAHLRLGVVHSPEPRVLDRFADDGYDLVLAGHTHGGQLCLPFYGALVTNCELDRSRVKGASQWGAHMKLHVSAGIGTSPWAPARFCCRPEATLLTLVPVKNPEMGSDHGVSHSEASVG
ncbi:metallophosphoesterase [Smaragdicoccus niigatensis]|uniref:metallophosphoesterase n=1 Tax=Smaragdicoccus niigatensis TaxID=359359 RepID=UPI000688BD72|nr:metallophosphoesterase [Smaragdicoccus niigatensis]